MLYSIGYGNKGLRYIIDACRAHRIETLIDIRERPYSRFHPEMNRAHCSRELKDAGISYIWRGDTLGGLTVKITEESLKQLVAESANENIVIMCAEHDYKKCHRYSVIGKRLADDGFQVLHIVDSGRADKHPLPAPEQMEMF